MTRGRPKADLVITDDERTQLTSFARSRSLPASLSARARIILSSAEGQANSSIAERLGLGNATVGKWRPRFIGAERCRVYVGCSWKRRLPSPSSSAKLALELEHSPHSRRLNVRLHGRSIPRLQSGNHDSSSADQSDLYPRLARRGCRAVCPRPWQAFFARRISGSVDARKARHDAW